MGVVVSCACGELGLAGHGVNSVEGGGNVEGLDAISRLELGHVRRIDPSVVIEFDLVRPNVVGLALEDGTVELHLVCGEFSVQLFAISQIVLGVPEGGLNLGGGVDGLENCLALSFSLAVCLLGDG